MSRRSVMVETGRGVMGIPLEVKMDENKCELCGATATHFCECSACQEAAGEDDHGRRPNDELGDGRWLCDVCSL